MPPTDHQRLLVKTARLYYEQSLTQAVRRTAAAFSPEGAAKLKVI